MTTNFVELEGGRVAYSVEGDGPLVVCVPGMGDLRTSYRFLAPALVERGFRVACMDLPGHGESSDRFTAYDDLTLGKAILAVIEDLGGPAMVVGNSMGAGAAVWASVEAPTTITGLALLGPFVRDPLINWVSRAVMTAMLVKPWGPAAWRAYFKKSFPSAPPADLDRHIADIKASMARGDHWRSFVKTTRTTHRPAEERIARITVPTLVVMGSKDQDWPDPRMEAQWVVEQTDGRLFMVDGAGHYPMVEFPDTVAPVIGDFVTEVTGGA